MSTITDPGTPRFYRYGGGWRRLIPNTWQRAQTWFFVIFLVATFGPMFHWFASSSKLVGGIPFNMAWILGWMVLQTLNMIGLYFTTIRKTARSIAEEIEHEDASALSTGDARPFGAAEELESDAGPQTVAGEGHLWAMRRAS
jgi:hypothetical protein